MSYTTYPLPFNMQQYAARQNPYLAFGVPVLYHRQPQSPDDSSNASSARSDHADSPESPIDPSYDYPPDVLGYTNPSYFSTPSEFGQNQLQIQIPSDTSHVTTYFDNGAPTNHTGDSLPLISHYSSMFPSPSNESIMSPFEEYIQFENDDSQHESSPSEAGDVQEDGRLHQTLSDEARLRADLNIPEPFPLNLSSLPDVPPLGRLPPIGHLIKLAIWGSPRRMLLINEIYKAVEDRYPWTADVGSIRHNLSLKAAFVNVKRTKHDRGKGGYWKLDMSRQGNKRDRRRKLFPDNKRGSSQRKNNTDYKLSGTFMDSDGEDVGTPASSSSTFSSPRSRRENALYLPGTEPGNSRPSSSSTTSTRRSQRRREHDNRAATSLSASMRLARTRLTSSSTSNLARPDELGALYGSVGVDQRFAHLSLNQTGLVDYDGYTLDTSYATAMGLPGADDYSNVLGLGGMHFAPIHRNTLPSSSHDLLLPRSSHSPTEASAHRHSTTGDMHDAARLHHPGPMQGLPFVLMEGASLTPPTRTGSRRLRSEESSEESDEVGSEGRIRGSPRPRSSSYRG